MVRVDIVGTHARRTFEQEDTAQQGVGVLGLLLHLVVEALVELVEAPVLVHARVDEVLVARGQLAGQQRVEVIDDFRMALHRGALPGEN